MAKKGLILSSIILILVGMMVRAFVVNSKIESGEITILLDWTPNTNHTGLFVADKLGFFKDEGLTVNILQPPQGDAVSLVSSGKAQFCIDSQDFIAPAFSEDKPLNVKAVAAIFQHNNSGIISKKESNINSFGNMEFKNYATMNNDIEQSMLKYCVEKSGGNFNNVNLVNFNTENICAALNAGIDAVWVYENIQKIQTDMAFTETNFLLVRDVDPVLDYYTPIILANCDYLNQNHDTAHKFMRAVSRGYNFAAEHPQEAANILLEAYPELDKEFIFESQKVSSMNYRADTQIWGIIDDERWNRFYRWLYENNAIKEKIKVDTFTNEFLYG